MNAVGQAREPQSLSPGPRGQATVVALQREDALEEFRSEPDAAGATSPAEGGQTRSHRRRTVVLLAVAALAQAPFVVLWLLQGPLSAATGTVLLETTPAGVEVWIEGRAVGRTPLTLSLAPGERMLELRHDGTVRTVPVTVRRGEDLRERLELPLAAPPVAAAAIPNTGTLEVTTEPARLPVSIDGVLQGVSPVVIERLPVGEHVVSVRFSSGPVERRIQVEPGSTASLLVTTPVMPGPLSGWITIDARAVLQIFEQGRLLGSSDIDRLMLPAGDHTLELVNEELGFRTQRAVRVVPGSTSAIPIELPRGQLAINAQPWAEVWIDGERIGETPIGSLSRPIGRHELVFRHPQLGERWASVLVTLREPARVGIDFRSRDGRD